MDAQRLATGVRNRAEREGFEPSLPLPVNQFSRLISDAETSNDSKEKVPPCIGGSSTGSSNSATLDPFDPDRALIVEQWASLPPHIRDAMLALVTSAMNTEPQK